MPEPHPRKWKKIGIVGSRRRANFADRILLEQTFLKIYKKGDRIVSGGCKTGADYFAEGIARKYNIPIIIHRAEWEQYGDSAGHIRNTLIAEECDILIAMVARDRTGGTEDTVRKTLRLNKIILLILHDGSITDATVSTKQETYSATAPSKKPSKETEADK